MRRRFALPTLLVVSLVLLLAGWGDGAPATRRSDARPSLSLAAGLAVDAALGARPDVVSGGLADHRLLKSRARLGLAMLATAALVVAAAMVTLPPAWSARHPTLRRHSGVARRAPPPPRLA